MAFSHLAQIPCDTLLFMTLCIFHIGAKNFEVNSISIKTFKSLAFFLQILQEKYVDPAEIDQSNDQFNLQ